MSESKFAPRRIAGAAADTIPRGRGIWIPGVGVPGRSYTGGGGEFGAQIRDEDRTFAICREPVAHRVVFTVAHDIFDNWFELKIKGDETEKQSKEFDEWIQGELDLLNAKRELTLAAMYERAYGWGILILGYRDEAKTLRGQLRKPVALEEIAAYGPPQIKKVDLDRNTESARYGLPLKYHVKRSGIGGDMTVHYTRVIHWATRRTYHSPDRSRHMWKGLSVLDPVWDDITTLRNIRWAMGQTMYRYGSGFPDFTFADAAEEDIQDWTEAGYFEGLSARTYFAHTDKQSVEFKGVAGHELNPMNYYIPIMENISAGTGIPLAILRGVQAGAITGSEVNQQEYYGLISDEQSAYEPYIRKLVKIIMGFAEPEDSKLKQIPDFTFDWLGGFELDEEKKARIESMKVDTLLKQGQFMTRNELRAAFDPSLEELKPEQGGEEILSVTPQGFEGEESFLVTPQRRKRSPRSPPG